MKPRIAFAPLALVSTAFLPSAALAQTAAPAAAAPPDAELIRALPGFTEDFATVNGVRLHYVAGGKGKPVMLLPGWPETWWAFHKIMPALARNHRVISVDLRGMGSSDKPAAGYEKRVMAKDIVDLACYLSYDKVDIVGHDISAQVAYAIAANYPQATGKLVLLDVAHPDAQVAQWPLLPQVGTFGDKIDDAHPFAWWFAFHQVKGLPEDLLEGRAYLEQRWIFRYLLKDESAIDARDRSIYAAAYNSRDAIRAGNAWYQTFSQDIADYASYPNLAMPVLALGGPGYNRLKVTLTPKVADLRVIKVEGSGHFIAEEKPEAIIGYLEDFLKR